MVEAVSIIWDEDLGVIAAPADASGKFGFWLRGGQ